MQIHFYDKNAKFRVSFHFFNCRKNVVFVKILFDLIKYIKCTHVRTINLKSYENRSKTMPSSLWLKKYIFKLNTLYYTIHIPSPPFWTLCKLGMRATTASGLWLRWQCAQALGTRRFGTLCRSRLAVTCFLH